MAKSTNISKTAYCRGVQCPKMMWLKVYNPDAFDESVMNQSVLNTGNEVGDLAMGLFGPFTEVKRDAESKMILETEKLIESGEKIIAEASLPSTDPSRRACVMEDDRHSLQAVRLSARGSC